MYGPIGYSPEAHRMDPARLIMQDVIAALELARRLKYTPLLHDLLESSQGALEEAMTGLDTSTHMPPLPPSPSCSVSPPSSTTKGSKYTDYVSEIYPFLRRLNSSLNNKQNMALAGKLWTAHRCLGNHDAIVAAAKKQAISEKTEAPLTTATVDLGADIIP